MERINEIIATLSTVRDLCNKALVKELKVRGITGLAPSHGSILQVIGSTKESLTMQEVARRVHKDKSTVTVLVNKLIDLGYVKKLKDPHDHRVSILTLTPEAWALEPQFREISKEVLERFYRGFSNHEKALITAMLERVKSNFI